MRTRRMDYPASTVLTMANGTGATLVSGSVVDLGAIGFGITSGDILNGASGAIFTEGRFEVPKQVGVAFAQGESVGWDKANTRIQALANGRGFGTIAETAAAGDDFAIVNLNQGPQVYESFVVANASGGGVTIDTGFGITPTGPIFVQITDVNGAARVINTITWQGGGNAGKVVIVTAAGAGTDKVYFRASRS